MKPWHKNCQPPITKFKKLYPEVWMAFTELGECCHEAGPLDERSRRLVKLALSIGAGLEGATHSAVRNARRAGLNEDEIRHVVALAVTTLGLPSATRAFTWIADNSLKENRQAVCSLRCRSTNPGR